MLEKQEMMMQILNIVRADRSLWPQGVSEAEAENYLTLIESLVNPLLNSSGHEITSENYQKAKNWAQSVLDIYMQKNPFQGAFVKPFAASMFETLDKIWNKRSQD